MSAFLLCGFAPTQEGGICVLGALAPWMLLIFGALDVAGAVWTALALRAQAARTEKTP